MCLQNGPLKSEKKRLCTLFWGRCYLPLSILQLPVSLCLGLRCGLFPATLTWILVVYMFSSCLSVHFGECLWVLLQTLLRNAISQKTLSSSDSYRFFFFFSPFSATFPEPQVRVYFVDLSVSVSVGYLILLIEYVM